MMDRASSTQAEMEVFDAALAHAHQLDAAALDAAMGALDARWRAENGAAATGVLHFILRGRPITQRQTLERVRACVRVVLAHGARADASDIVWRPTAIAWALKESFDAPTPEGRVYWTRLYHTLREASPPSAAEVAHAQYGLAVSDPVVDPYPLRLRGHPIQVLHAVFWGMHGAEEPPEADVLVRLRNMLPRVVPHTPAANALVKRALLWVLHRDADGVGVVRAILDGGLGVDPMDLPDPPARTPARLLLLLEEAAERARARMLALAMGTHPRLGAQGLLRLVDADLLARHLAPACRCLLH